MKSLADALPPEIARQIHSQWRQNEAAYWAVRDRLRGQYEGKWIGFAEGAIIAVGSRPLEVFVALEQSRQHPFIVRVGHEDEPWYRVRRANFNYDTTYPTTALPVIDVEFRATRGGAGILLNRVIPTRARVQRRCRGRIVSKCSSTRLAGCLVY